MGQLYSPLSIKVSPCNEYLRNTPKYWSAQCL